MILKRFRAKDFRNIESCDIEFAPGVNLLHGKNAQGKTNALEGIYLFSRGKSFRGRDDAELIRFGCEGFRISLDFEDKDGENSLEYALFGKDRLRKKNGYKVKKVNDLIDSFKAVLFYPDNLRLIKGGPDERREFLNVAVSQCYPSYISFYSDFKKALENRNCLLKLSSKGFYIDDGELLSWSESLAEYSSYIYVMRKKYIERIKGYARDIMKDISDGGEELYLAYESSVCIDSDEREAVKREYIRLYEEHTDREKAAGTTLHGPHRDDIIIEINGRDARKFASQGQQRSTVLSMKLAEGEVIREMIGEYPVFLFDDVLSELDEKRKKYVLSGAGERQIIITSCEPDECRGFDYNEIDVSGGVYVSSHR